MPLCARQDASAQDTDNGLPFKFCGEARGRANENCNALIAVCGRFRDEKRVAQPLDLAGTINTLGAPFFAQFAKGGNQKCLRCGW